VRPQLIGINPQISALAMTTSAKTSPAIKIPASLKLKSHYKKIRYLLGDQLNANHSWFREKDPDTLYIMAELPQELSYCRHHIQKVCAFLAAMEAFAGALNHAGHHCLFLTLDETHAYKTTDKLLNTLLAQFSAESIEFQAPDEIRLANTLAEFCAETTIKTAIVSTEHFLIEDPCATEWQLDSLPTMEHFYRRMRKRCNILVKANGQPVGGRWNFDQENREKLTRDDLQLIPKPKRFRNDVSAIITRLKKYRVETFGKPEEKLLWPVTRRQARETLTYFCENLLPHFGQFQDAMTEQSTSHWSLYHSRISFALNAKILSPKETIATVLKYYEEHNQAIKLASVEGFIRQILGWREYVRLIYWQGQPGYGKQNFLHAKRNLPDFFWSGETKMNCLHKVIQQSLDYSYAHHIQRLMVSGNFCLLAGINPSQVDAWYLGIYVDAIEWVEQPNTRGMSQYADGGMIATKPYAASGNYINKMSDYCQSCHYKVKEKIGDAACPLNSLYWHFLDRHKNTFAKNHRMAMMYRQWDKKTEGERSALLKQGKFYLDNIESL